jgi:hypothetical protein
MTKIISVKSYFSISSRFLVVNLTLSRFIFKGQSIPICGSSIGLDIPSTTYFTYFVIPLQTMWNNLWEFLYNSDKFPSLLTTSFAVGPNCERFN